MTSMTDTATFSRTDLARKTREILELVRKGKTAVIQSFGEEQAILLDPLDYRLLQGVAGVFLGRAEDGTELREVLHRYLDEEITLGKVAESLGISRFELMERFQRLGIPLNFGPANVEDARREVEVARGHG